MKNNQNNEFAAQFTDRIELRGAVHLSAEHVGLLLTAFPVIGGGRGCIVIHAEGMVVRLVQGPSGFWIAEHLVVAGGGV